MRIRFVARVTAVLAAGLLWPLAGSTSVTDYWASVPAASSLSTLTLPPGCVCAKDSSLSSCSEFECTCSCDLTAGECDENCCCDAECSATELASFQAAGTCIATATPASVTQKCIDTSAITTINTRDRMVLNAAQNGFADMLCVTTDNNPAKGPFYTDPGTPGASAFAAASSSGSLATSATQTAATASSATAYAFGDTVTTTHASGSLPVLAAEGRQECAARAVGYQQDAAARDCLLVAASDWCTVCASQLSWGPLSSFSVYTSPSASASVAVVPSFRVRDANGTASTVAASAVAATAAMPAGTGCTCNNAVVEAAFTVNTTSAGAITGVSVEITVANVTAPATNAFFASPHRSSVSFVTTDATVSTSTYPRSKSGNPGYIGGLPVVAGTTVSATVSGVAKQAVQPLPAPTTDASAGALLLPGPDGTGACVAPLAGTAGPRSVGFLRDASSQCVVAVTPATLATLCTTAGPPAELTVPASLMVGLFGNADPLRVNEWLAVTVEPSTLTGVFDATSNTCSQLVTGVHYDLVAARTGHASDPQWKIVAARATYSSTTALSLGAGASAGELRYTATATFSRLPDAALTTLVPPTPPLLPELPRDIFFPFTSAAGDAAVARGLVVMLAALACLCHPLAAERLL